MDIPDFQQLAETTTRPAVEWSDAWLTLRNATSHEGVREAIWDATVSMSVYARPLNIVDTLLKMSVS